MDNIDKRARESVPDLLRINGNYVESYILGYCYGATEQKDIDIDTACKYFADYLFEIGCPDDWCRDSKAQMNGEQRFRKAMEE